TSLPTSTGATSKPSLRARGRRSDSGCASRKTSWPRFRSPCAIASAMVVPPPGRLRGFAIAILSDLRSVIQVVRIRGREVTEETGDALGHRGKEHRSLCSRCRLWIADAGVLGCG